MIGISKVMNLSEKIEQKSDNPSGSCRVAGRKGGTWSDQKIVDRFMKSMYSAESSPKISMVSPSIL